MKTNYNSNQTAAFSACRTLTSTAMIALMLLMVNCNRLFSQADNKMHLNMGVDAYVSGSNHGMFYSGYVGASKGRHVLNVGPCMQNHSMLVRGARLSYGYILTGYKDRGSLTSRLENEDDRVQLRVFSYMQYVDRLPLSTAAISREEKLNSNERDWNSLRFSTAEAGLGISLNIKVSQRIYWRNSLTVSGYYHTDSPANLCQGRQGVMLSVGTGFNIPSL